MHVIAAKAAAFQEALLPEFKEYQKRVIENAAELAFQLKELGFKVVSGGTDNHLILLEVKSLTGLTGKDAEKLLDKVNITTNKNTVPNDTEKPFITSGIRLGSPAVTTRGFQKEDMQIIAKCLFDTLMNPEDENVLNEVRKSVKKLTTKYPLNY